MKTVHNKKFELILTKRAKAYIAVPVRKLSVYPQPFRRSLFLSVRCSRKWQKINKNRLFRKFRVFQIIDVDTTKKLVTIVMIGIACPCLSATVFTKDWPTTVK